MTLEQLRTELRVGYEGHNHDAFYRALKWIGSVASTAEDMKHPIVTNQMAEWPIKEHKQ